MLNEDAPEAQQSSRKWVWTDCKLVLRRMNPQNKTEQSYENLQAEVELESQDIQEPFMPEISFLRQLQYNAKRGYSCKKDTLLPPLKVCLPKNYHSLLNEDQEIIMIYCDLTIVYPRRKDTHFYLQQIQTEGVKRKRFSEETGEIVFDNILLKESSLKKSNNKFSFLISVCASSIEESRIILKTLISTAFYSQPPKITRRNRFLRPISTIKLLSPVKFLKPIPCLNTSTVKENSMNQIIQSIKEMNKNCNRLAKMHPFYLIYHLIDIIEVYYDSEQIKDLTDMLQKLCPFIENQQLLESAKNNGLKYELKKTKIIKKNNENSNAVKKVRFQPNLKIHLNNCIVSESHPILITFHREIVQWIWKEIQRERTFNQQSNFQQEIEKEVIFLTKMFQHWPIFQFQVDLLRKNTIESYWKDIEKESVYEIYKKYYRVLHSKLFKRVNNFADTQKLTNDMV